MKRIAIIGSGISGLGAAWALKDTADITVFEAEDRAGGHACTVDIEYDGTPLSVDVGFIVYNELNYPNLTGLFEALGVATRQSDMSFSVSNPDGFEWASTLKGMFAQKRNLVRPRFHRFWRTILKFNDVARGELERGAVEECTLGSWLETHGFGDDFRDNYILPMGGAIWSTPEREILDYPALSFFRFFDNHRLMHKERPKWRTVSGGSRQYVNAVGEKLGDRLQLSSPVKRVTKFGEQVMLHLDDGRQAVFDDVILATHSDTSGALLGPEFEEERFLLRSARYRPNQAYLHRDAGYMPKRKSAWASWNVQPQEDEDICLTYWINRLQGQPADFPLFLTLNPQTPPAESDTFASFTMDHPQFDAPARAACRSLKRRQGRDGLWFAGAWLGNGFHEDGLVSGLSAALSLGGKVEWDAQNIERVQPGNSPARPGEDALAIVG